MLAASKAAPREKLRGALLSLITIARSHPHRYRLMFTTPAADPTAVVKAAERSHDLFLDIVAKVVGPRIARQYGALLLTTTHGAIGLQLSGHLGSDKWQSTAEDVMNLAISRLPTGDNAGATSEPPVRRRDLPFGRRK